ncbi:MAG: PaaI family thioesterase [Candidatus Dormibacteria bacterium]
MSQQSPVPAVPEDWLNDTSTYQRCFVCGSKNVAGLRVEFRQQGDRIATTFTGDDHHQGFPGVVHGGIVAALLDETMGRTALFKRAWTMTGRLEVRYRRPTPCFEPLTVSGWLVRGRRDAFEARAEVVNAQGEVLAEGKGLFLRVPEEVRQQAEDAHPELGPYFRAGIPRDEG